MLRTFGFHGYRNLRIDEKQWPMFGRINLLVGPNNSGKSNFIKAMGFPRDLMLSEGGPTKFLHTVEMHGRAEALRRISRAEQAKGRRGNDPDIFFYWILGQLAGSKPGTVVGSGNSDSVPAKLMYFIGYNVGDSASFPSGFYIGGEGIARYFDKEPALPSTEPSFSVHCGLDKGIGKATFERRMPGSPPSSPPLETVKLSVETNESILFQKDTLLKDKAFYEKAFHDFTLVEQELMTFSRGFRSYASTDLDVRKMAEGAKIDLSVRALDKEGSEFVNVLRYLDQQHDFLDEYTERVRELIPEMKRLKVVDASDTYKQLELNIGGQKYKPREMSDGTLKALWLALLLFSPEKGSVLSIDEPELNMHPAWLKVIGGWLQRFTSAEQIFVSTHSPDLLDTFTDGFKTGDVALFVFGLGEKELRRVEPAELADFFKEGWDLGDIYRVGEPKLGGWPW